MRGIEKVTRKEKNGKNFLCFLSASGGFAQNSIANYLLVQRG